VLFYATYSVITTLNSSLTHYGRYGSNYTRNSGSLQRVLCGVSAQVGGIAGFDERYIHFPLFSCSIVSGVFISQIISGFLSFFFP
jgi:hypothetical protein